VRHDVLTDQLDEIRQPYVTVRVCSWLAGLSTRLVPVHAPVRRVGTAEPARQTRGSVAKLGWRLRAAVQSRPGAWHSR